VIVNVWVVTVQFDGVGDSLQLVFPPPRFGQFTRQIALGGLITLICAVSVAHSNVLGIVAFNCVELIPVTVMAVSLPAVATPVNVTDEPPFCDVGRKFVPVSVTGMLAHLVVVESQ
jgi:hypothetical protein